jgi:hypothetical protein
MSVMNELNQENCYTVAYSWPWQLMGPLCFILAASLPILVVEVEWKPLHWGIAVVSGVFVLIGLGATWTLGKRIVIRGDNLEVRAGYRWNLLRWSQMTSFETRDGKFILKSSNLRTALTVDMLMSNADRFARDVDRHFTPDGKRRVHAG